MMLFHQLSQPREQFTHHDIQPIFVINAPLTDLFPCEEFVRFREFPFSIQDFIWNWYRGVFYYIVCFTVWCVC